MILQCSDRPIDNALGVVNKERHYRILTPNELGLSSPALHDCAKFQKILFKIATTGAITVRQTDRQADASDLSHDAAAIG